MTLMIRFQEQALKGPGPIQWSSYRTPVIKIALRIWPIQDMRWSHLREMPFWI